MTTIYHTPASLARAMGVPVDKILDATGPGGLTPVGYARAGSDRLIPLYALDAVTKYVRVQDEAPVAEKPDPRLLEEFSRGEHYQPHPEHGWNQPVQAEAHPVGAGRRAATLQAMMNRSTMPPIGGPPTTMPQQKTGQECLASDCSTITWTKTQLFCTRHWKMLPDDMQKRLNHAVFDLKPEDAEYQDTMLEAIQWLNQLD